MIMFTDIFDNIDYDGMDNATDFVNGDINMEEDFTLKFPSNDTPDYSESLWNNDEYVSLFESDTEINSDEPLFQSDNSEFSTKGASSVLDFGSKYDNLSFMGKDILPSDANSDGYIPDGKVTLTSTIGDLPETFKMYAKDGHSYALYNGHYYRIDGPGTVTINGIKYDKI